MSILRVLPVIGVAVVLVLAAGGCSRVGYVNQVTQPVQTCDQASSAAIQYERQGITGADLDDELQFLADNCPEAYDITVDYLSSRATISSDQVEPCSAWGERIHAEAVEMLRADGLCTEGSTENAESASGGLSWDAAVGYIGSEQRVCGPLASTRLSEDDVFLNVGRDYPDPARFTIVIWDVGVVEQLPAGTQVCTTGTISSYNGVAQIELRDVGAVEVWE